jgi:putative hydrolase of HD superfamily
MTPAQRLAQQVAFIAEIDKLKHIQRQTILLDRSRRENDAEHSWHLAMMVMLLAEHSNHPIDSLRVLKMVLVHDLVEIDAGDTYAYDEGGHHDKSEREQAAADRLFAMLPSDQGRELRNLWDEFEERKTADARFAGAVDRMQPLLHNCLTEGETWLENDVVRSQVIRRCQPIEYGSERLWDYMLVLIDQAVADGHLEQG